MVLRHAISMAVIGLAMATVGSSADAQTRKTGDAVNGRILSLRWCASCHSLGRRPSPKAVAPNFAWIKTHRSANQIRSFLFAPHGQMPRLDLSRRQINDAAAFIKSVDTDPKSGRSGEI
ncbi:MAG: cytochrome c [Rhodospirillaceae bacterium]|nr:cytochrome c [Rhodospirillaceae bacterium]MBT3886995.1 cytochrome c [Rhodospirillaceae bacterium]MBT4117445.1 cytochrome c [Rhodospirillaceae bacterium]MBT4672166.1 cytochrome c [Rhodospirillaceae bacterium]MBT4719510.1 cytochrome c [Rhodospirillaceae bacterium]